MGRRERERGKRGELEVRNVLRDHGFTVRATQRNLGGDQGDMLALGKGRVFHVETKLRETLNIWASLTQTINECPADATPLLTFRRNGTQWFAAMPLLSLLDVLDMRHRCSYCGQPTDNGLSVCQSCVDVLASDEVAK